MGKSANKNSSSYKVKCYVTLKYIYIQINIDWYILIYDSSLNPPVRNYYHKLL